LGRARHVRRHLDAAEGMLLRPGVVKKRHELREALREVIHVAMLVRVVVALEGIGLEGAATRRAADAQVDAVRVERVHHPPHLDDLEGWRMMHALYPDRIDL